MACSRAYSVSGPVSISISTHIRDGRCHTPLGDISKFHVTRSKSAEFIPPEEN